MARVGGRLSVLVILSTLFSVDVSLNHKHVPCSPVGRENCNCAFPDGQSLDLTPLRSSDFQWTQADDDPEYSVFLSPCGSIFKNESVECYQASVCLSFNDTHYVNLGTSKDASLVVESIGREPYILYTVASKVTTVLLKCYSSLEKPEVKFISASKDNYVLELRSRESCLKSEATGRGGGGGGGAPPSRLGIWSVLLLIALVLLLSYFLGGILVLRYIQGARGIEMIPNHQFWLHLPTHFKNGVLFLVNGCKTQTTYDKI